MKILLLDFEATGVDTKTSRVLEIGAMVVDENFEPTGQKISTLVWESGYPALTPDVEKVTNITQDMLNNGGVPPVQAFGHLSVLAEDCDFIVAYNRAYDQELFKAEMERLGLVNVAPIHSMLQIPWICAMADIETNYAFKSWRLMHMALEYGVTVNPKELHRALADVELMCQMLKASATTPGGMHKFQQEPWVVVRALTKKPWDDGGKSNDAAKALGFKWERTHQDAERVFEKMWVRRIKERHLEELLNNPTVKIVRIA